MIKAFIFDLDGTLIDTSIDIGIAVNYSLKLNNLKENDLNIYKTFLGNGSKVLIKKSLGNTIVNEDLFTKIYNDYLNYYENNVCVYSKPYKNMLETLLKLKEKGYLLFVITNKPQLAASKLIDTLFKNIFTKVIGITNNIKTKPDLNSMLNLLDEYKLKSNEVTYIGDSDVDMIFANNCQVKYKVACLYGYREKEELLKYNPDYILDNEDDIPNLLNIN